MDRQVLVLPTVVVGPGFGVQASQRDRGLGKRGSRGQGLGGQWTGGRKMGDPELDLMSYISRSEGKCQGSGFSDACVSSSS